MRYVSPAKLVALSILSSMAMFGQLTITNYQLVSQQAASTVTTYTYTAQVVNTGVAVGSVTATASAGNPFAFRLAANQGTLNFGPVASNGTATSTNTFSVIAANNTPIVFTNNISWSFTTTPVGPTANAGSNQTVAVGSTATLNGSGSTNPSGSGTLTYQWVFLSRPTGSLTVLFNPQGVNPTFLVDVKGTYVIQLTVGNGSGQTSTSTVTVTTGTVPPVANAGPNRSADIGATVTLNGSASSDSNGNKLTYLWTLPVLPTSSQAALTGATTVNPTFVPDLVGTYVAQLVVNDGTQNSAASMVTITTGNVPPVANAGPAQTLVPIGSTVKLSGSASSDQDGDPLTYSWSLPTLPTGSKAVLNNTTVVNPTFTADLPGTYVPQLIVDDGSVASNPSTVTITTSAPQPPVANAGLNQTVKPNTIVSLSGSGSTDPQNFQLTYSWSLIHTPANSQATLIGATTATPTFLADLAGTYVAQLVVNDGYLSSNPALAGSTVTISSSVGLPPSANAGPPQNVAVGATVTLNGSGSTDPQSATPLTYSWTMTSTPSGSQASLTNPKTVSPTFVADVAGAYVVQLVVTDTLGLSSTPSNAGSTVMITATSTPSIVLQSGVTVNVGGQTTVNLSLSSAPTSGTVFVSLVSSNTGAVTLPALNFVLSNTTPVAVKVNGVGFGSSNITATASGYVTGTTTVVSADTASFSPNTVTINGETTVQGASYLILSSPASSPMTLSLTSSNPSIATVPATVTISANANNVSVPVTGVSGGTATITATSSTALATPATLKVTVNAVAITTTALNNANWHVQYSEQLNASGGTPGYTWSLAPGSTPLPTGMTVSASGLLGGTPIPPGSTEPTENLSVTFKVADSSVPQQTATVTLPLTVLAGIPANITPVTGTTPQQTADTTAFPTPLAVIVTDVYGNPVPNASVTFTVTAGNTGASGTFASSAPVITNSSGIATAPALTANGTLGSFTVSASVPPVASPNPQPTPATFTLTNVVGVPATVTPTPGTPQTAVEGMPFTNPLVVTVKDAGGNPVPNALVTFTISTPATGGATGTFANNVNTATTGTNGVATSVQFTAGAKVGTYTVSAASGTATTVTPFSFTNTYSTPVAIAVYSGNNNQQAAANAPFAQPLVAIVTDSGGNGVPNVNVTFTAAVGTLGQSATFTPANGIVQTASTGTIGTATIPATANAHAGASYSVTAVAANVSGSATFTLMNVSGPAAFITVSGGTSGQSVADGAAFTPLVVLVTDSAQNPVNNQKVTFTIFPNSTTGATASFAGGVNTATTNANGLATSSALTANNNIGAFTITANTTPTNVPTAATFSLTSIVGPATQVQVSTLPANVQINQPFAPLVAKVLDQGGNLVTTAVNSVTFTPATTAASGTFTGGPTSVVNTVNGLATASTYTANLTAGADTVTAFLTLTPTATTTFALTNLVGPPFSITATGGMSQGTAFNNPFATALSATVKDMGGNLVPGVNVLFTAPSSTASATFSGNSTTTVTTGANGVATTVVPVANGGVGGPYNVAANVTSPGTPLATPAAFALTNNPGSPAAITPNSPPTSAQVGTTYALSVTVTDNAQHLLSGVSVTFTAATGSNGQTGSFGASGASTTVQTNSSGVATATLTANTKTGTFTVSGTAGTFTVASLFSLMNTPGPAAQIVTSGGTPQNIAINTNFATPLTATVQDQYGNAVPGVTVTFAGAGTTANAAVLTAMPVTSSATGTVSASVKSNSVAGSYSVTATASGVTTPASFALTNNPGLPATITIVPSGNSQQVGITLAYAPLSVTVTDAGNNLVPGVTVTFAPATGNNGQSATFAGANTAITNSSGVATTQSVLTANKITGIFAVNVTATTGNAAQVSFSETNIPGPPFKIAINGSASLSAQVPQQFAAMAVTVTDAGGNFVAAGTPVTFAASAAGNGATGTFTGSATVQVVGANGVATAPVFTANTTAGAYTVGVTSGSVSITGATGFQMTNTPAGAATIAASGGTSGQSMQVNLGTATTSRFGAISVAVQDQYGNLLGVGTSVTFTAPGSGPTGLFGTSPTISEQTNASGVATVPAGTLVVGTVAGNFNLTVTVPSTSATYQFPLMNSPGSVAAIAVSSGSLQQAQLGLTSFANPLIALVTDANQNPINNVSVTFTAPGGGPTGTFANGTNTTMATTGTNGLATSTIYTPSTTSGTGADNVTAKAGSFSTTFNLTNLPGNPATITKTSSSDNQSQTVGNPGTAFTNPLIVTIKDLYGNVVPNVVVTFAAVNPTTGASGTFANTGNGTTTATTNTSGVATSSAYSPNTHSGADGVLVSVTPGNAPTQTFNLTNLAGSATQLVPVSPSNSAISPYSAAVNTLLPLVANEEDAYGNTVTTLIQVSFTATPNGTTGASTVSSQSVVTSSGVATATSLTANLKLGAYTVTAKSGTLTAATFYITNITGPVASLTIPATNSGNNQTATVGSPGNAYPVQLAVFAGDAGGNPVSGVPVTFSVLAGVAGGSFSPTTVTTGVSGLAQTTLFTNTVAGTVSVQASTPKPGGGTALSLGTPFAETNLAGPVAKIVPLAGGSGQSALVGTPFASPLQALATDIYDNAVSGANVTFTVPLGGSAKPVFSDNPTGNTTTAVSANGSGSTTLGVATSFPITAGQIPGSYTITPSVGSIISTTGYTLTNITTGSTTGTITLSGPNGTPLASLGQNMMTQIQVNLPIPGSMVTAPVNVTVTTDGVNLLLGQGTGVQSAQVTINAGTNFSDFYVQAQGNTGTFPITFDAPGYTSDDSSTITVVPSGFILVAPGDSNSPPMETGFSTYVGSPSTLTLYAVQLNSGDNFVSPYTVGTIRGGYTASIPITVSGGVGTITSPVTMAAGSSYTNLTFTATAQGTGSITLGTVTGYTTPKEYQSLTATVAASSIVAPTVAIGNNLETSVQFTLDGVVPTTNCPAGYQSFTVSTSSSVLLLSNTPTQITPSGLNPGNSISVGIQCGQSQSQTFYMEVVGGTVGNQITYTITPPTGIGFSQTNGTVTVGPSGFVIYDANGGSPTQNQSFTTIVSGPSDPLAVSSYLLSAQNNGVPLTAQMLAYMYPGSINITLSSTQPSVGTASPVTIAPLTGGASPATSTFTAVTGGTGASPTETNIQILTQPGGFQTPASAYTTILAKVQDPALFFPLGGTGTVVGQFLETPGVVQIGVAVPQTGAPAKQIQLQVTSGNILLSANGTDGGTTGPFTLTIPPGTNQTPVYYIYGLNSGGTGVYTATDVTGTGGGTEVGYNPASATITMAPSGVALIATSIGTGQQLNTSISGSQPQFSVYVGYLGGADGTTFLFPQLVSGFDSQGVQANLSLNPGLGTLGQTTVTLLPQTQSAQVSYTPTTQGTDQIQIVPGSVSGVSDPSGSDQNLVTVFVGR